MSPDLKDVIDAALQLTPEARAKVVEALLETLDQDEDFPISAEWLQEIRRRCEDIDTGRVELLDGEGALRELRAKHSA